MSSDAAPPLPHPDVGESPSWAVPTGAIRYRLAWFQGDVQIPEEYYQSDVSQDEIMDWAQNHPGHLGTPVLRVLLVPEDADLTTLTGDDWNDAPAECNASEPYRVPEGSRWVELRLGDAWPH